jgi:hypothetical protein
VINKPGMPCADKRADCEAQFKNSRFAGVQEALKPGDKEFGWGESI